MFGLSRQVTGPVLRVSSRFFTNSKPNVLCRPVMPVQFSSYGLFVGENMRSVLAVGIGNYRNAFPVNSCAVFRGYSTDKEVEKTAETPTAESAKDSSGAFDSAGTTSRSREPTNFERKIFVWTGRYKTVGEVPNLVSEAALSSAKSKFRIYINLMMGAATLLAAIGMIIIGKQRSKKGESLSNLNIKRHPEAYGKLLEANEAKK